MSDGQVLIDSKLDTQGVQKGTDELQGLFTKTAETAAKAANTIEKGFQKVNYKEAFEKLPASYQSAYAKIETIRANDSLSEKLPVCTGSLDIIRKKRWRGRGMP